MQCKLITCPLFFLKEEEEEENIDKIGEKKEKEREKEKEKHDNL